MVFEIIDLRNFKLVNTKIALTDKIEVMAHAAWLKNIHGDYFQIVEAA